MWGSVARAIFSHGNYDHPRGLRPMSMAQASLMAPCPAGGAPGSAPETARCLSMTVFPIPPDLDLLHTHMRVKCSPPL